MSGVRGALAGVLVLVVAAAVVLQVSVFPHLAWRGVGPDLVLLVVVGAALVRGPQFGMVLGFAAGVLLDLTPPSDHVAGRWALALLVVGYVAGRVARDARRDTRHELTGAARPPTTLVLATVGACSLLGTSVFALTGVLLRDPPVAVPSLLPVVLAALVWDLLLAPLVVPAVMRMTARLEPEHAT